jgi:hypothetical protein
MKFRVFLRSVRTGRWRFAWRLLSSTAYGLTHTRCFQCHRRKGLSQHSRCYTCQMDNLRRALEDIS